MSVRHTKRMAAPPSFSRAFAELETKRSLGAPFARRIFDTIVAGGWTPLQTGTLLGSLQLLGQSPPLAVVAARALRSAMTPLSHDKDLVLDVARSGVESKRSPGLALGIAPIVAAAGVPVALHGDEERPPGEAQVLAALGIPFDMPAAANQKVLEVTGIAYAATSLHHPGLRYLSASRRELGIATLVDLLGPLVNPASPSHHLVFAGSDETRQPLAEALAALGSKRAWVAHAADGVEALSPFGETRVSVLSLRQVREGVVTPADFGLKPSPPGALDGGSASTNAGIIAEVLSGRPHPARTGFVMNAAACLAIARDMRLAEAAELAEQLIDSGRAISVLQRWGAACRAQQPKT